MSNTVSYSDPQQDAANSTAQLTESPELKLYQAFIFSIPVFFTFVLLFLFYLFYLRRRGGVDWNSLRMRTSSTTSYDESDDSSSRPTGEMGLKKEVREMLPIIVFKESFSVNDTQCSVCLGDYQIEEKLQQIPSCGHTFHVECIDSWLSTHATCPLCRQSLISSSAKDKAGSSTTELVLVVQRIDNNTTTLDDNLDDDDDAVESPPNRNISQQQHQADDSCYAGQRILTP